MMNFKAGDTWETIFLIRGTGGSKEKIQSPCVIVKTAFPKNNNSGPKGKIPVRSDPMRSPIRPEIRSDPIRSPIWNPIFVNGPKNQTF